MDSHTPGCVSEGVSRKVELDLHHPTVWGPRLNKMENNEEGRVRSSIPAVAVCATSRARLQITARTQP